MKLLRLSMTKYLNMKSVLIWYCELSVANKKRGHNKFAQIYQ